MTHHMTYTLYGLSSNGIVHSLSGNHRDQNAPRVIKDAMASGPVIKKSNIRIWIHQRNLGHLQRVMWEGQGNLLLVEHSNNPKVRKFFEAVPHIMVRPIRLFH